MGPATATPLRAALVARCPTLTVRELDVCERLLRGWTCDGIAADLRLSVTTVKTYRARAFDRMGCTSRASCLRLSCPGTEARGRCRPVREAPHRKAGPRARIAA